MLVAKFLSLYNHSTIPFMWNLSLLSILLNTHWVLQTSRVIAWSSQVLQALLPADSMVLDLCAAPGSKSTQLGQFLSAGSANGMLVANELDLLRAGKLRANLLRVGLMILGYWRVFVWGGIFGGKWIFLGFSSESWQPSVEHVEQDLSRWGCSMIFQLLKETS